MKRTALTRRLLASAGLALALATLEAVAQASNTAPRGNCYLNGILSGSNTPPTVALTNPEKIALNGAMAAGRLSRRARDGLLARMTGDVTALVLRNNYLQGQALSVLQAGATERAGGLAELIGLLERSIGLDRRLENLPGEEELAERRRQGAGFTRPELAMLQSWARIWLDERLLQSDVPEDPYLGRELERCFPAPMRRRFAPWIAGHRLRREIIATATTSGLVNRMGPAFVPRMAEETGAGVGAVVRAWTIAREITGMRTVWHAIESLDHRLPASVHAPVHGVS